MRLFLLDDAAVMRALVVSVANDLGHTVVGTAASLPEAVATLRHDGDVEVDVVLLDGRIPSDDDIATVTQKLALAVPDAAIVTIAALDERELVRRSCEAGAIGALLRPVSRSGLAAALAAVDRLREATRDA